MIVSFSKKDFKTCQNITNFFLGCSCYSLARATPYGLIVSLSKSWSPLLLYGPLHISFIRNLFARSMFNSAVQNVKNLAVQNVKNVQYWILETKA